MRRFPAVVTALVTLVAGGCASTSTTAGRPRHAPTSSPSASASPSSAADPHAAHRRLGRFGLPLLRAGLHIDPALLQLARTMHVDLRTELGSTEQRVLGALHGQPVHIVVRIDDRVLVPEWGVGGDTGVDTSVVIDVEPGAPVGTFATLHDYLPYVLAHELDHVVRFQDGPGIGVGTLLDDFVSEGLAESFAAATFPRLPPSPTETGLTRAQLRYYWSRAQGDGLLYMYPPRQMHERWMFGGGGFPHNTGYAIGTAMIHSLRERHPHLSWATLTRMDTQSLLDLSRFRP